MAAPATDEQQQRRQHHHHHNHHNHHQHHHQPPPRPHSILSSLPNITTTISSILASPPPQAESSAPNTAAAASPSTFASLLPATPTWWKRAVTPTTPTAHQAGARLDTTTTNTDTTSPKETTIPSKETTPSHSPVASAAVTSSAGMEEAVLTRRASEDSAGGSSRKRKRPSRPKTCYSICHAPPRHGGRHKIQVRARPLLQLHKIQSRSRPRPAFELLPSAIFSPRLVRAIAQFFDTKHALNPTDLAVVRAEKYHAHEASAVEEDESRDILAVICGFAKGHVPSTKVKIMLEGGVEWEACQLPTGSYEATTTDDHGLKRVVRWVPKRNGVTKAVTSPSLVSPTGLASPAADASVDKKFNFSTISQTTRRHPVIAHLTTSSLDISDVYSLPLPSTSVDSAGQAPPSPAFVRTQSNGSKESADDVLTTTEELRNIITATAIYVALCEGWCTSYRGEDSVSRSVSQKSVSPGKPSHSPVKGRPASLESDSIRRTSSLRQALRSPTFRFTGRNNDAERPPSSGASSLVAPDPIPTIPEGDGPVTRRRRADTTSTVIVNSGGRRWRPTSHDDETDDEEADGDDHPATTTAHEGVDGKSSRPGSMGSSERKRNFSESTFTGSETSGYSAVKEKLAATKHRELEKKKEKKKGQGEKRGFLSTLLCGMV